MFDEARMLTARSQVESLIALTGISAGDAVDLCCGPGRHSVELARLGFRVTGVDRTERYLQRAERRASALKNNGTPIGWVLEDVRTFCRPESFDLALNLYTSFGYFDAPEDDALFARNVARSLRKGGMLVIQTQGKELVARDFVPRFEDERGGWRIVDERRITNGFERIENRWTLTTAGQREEIVFSVRLYSAAELGTLLLSAGFSSVAAYGSLEGIPYDQSAERLVVVARK